ncbi:MAG TPA: hypothetical protein VKX33_04620 [Cyclobacteriaceae bacterium]|nr:hypothetical protein [Cyclobacteriaceae bacterium]
MERTITFIAEHKKRENEQVKNDVEFDVEIPQEQQDVAFDPESLTAEY